ncbi:MAG: M48 family metallopeptidase [Pseudomonadales bacterium]
MDFDSQAKTENILSGYLYDGQSSGRTSIDLIVDSEGKLSCHGANLADLDFIDVDVSSRVGNSARYLDLGNGFRFETLDNNTVDQLCDRWHPANHGLADRLERNMKLVAVAVLVISVGSFTFVRYGIPALSKPIAALVPESFDQHLGRQTLESMDGVFFQVSNVDDSRQQTLQQRFQAILPVAANDEQKFRLLFRSARGMPNALALPDGTVILTDELVKLADNDEQLVSILLHEVAHVEQRHSIQMLVRQTSLSLLILLITGDVSTASSTVLLLPAWIAQASYSQGLETAADTYALEQMKARNMDTNAFADIMEKLGSIGKDTADGQGAAKNDNQNSSILDYLSSHPATQQRIERFRTENE